MTTTEQIVMRAVAAHEVWTWVDDAGQREWQRLVTSGLLEPCDYRRTLESLLAKGELDLPVDIDIPAPVLPARAGVEIGGQS